MIEGDHIRSNINNMEINNYTSPILTTPVQTQETGSCVTVQGRVVLDLDDMNNDIPTGRSDVTFNRERFIRNMNLNNDHAVDHTYATGTHEIQAHREIHYSASEGDQIPRNTSQHEIRRNHNQQDTSQFESQRNEHQHGRPHLESRRIQFESQGNQSQGDGHQFMSHGNSLNFNQNSSNLNGPTNTNMSRFQNRSTRQECRPNAFDGRSVDFNDYIAHFEIVAEWNRWHYNDMALQLCMHLSGRALSELAELPPFVRQDYSTLKSSLAKRFSHTEHTMTYQSTLAQKTIGQNESPNDYAFSLKRLTQKAYPSINLNDRETIAITHFIAGLRPIECKMHVQFGRPTSLSNAASLAEEFMAFQKSTISSKPNMNYRNTAINYIESTGNEKIDDYEETYNICAVQQHNEHYNKNSNQHTQDKKENYQQKKDNYKQSLSDKIDMLVENIAKLVESTQMSNARTNYTSNSNYKNYNKKDDRNGKRPYKCFICGDESHFAKKCPQKQVNSNDSKQTSGN